MTVRGRKRKNFGKRKQPTTRAGRAGYDAGTPEALAKKADLLWARMIWDGKVPRFIRPNGTEIAGLYAEYPLGVLYARGMITVRQHDVGIALDKFRNFSGMKAPGFSGSGQCEFVDRNFGELLHLNDDDAQARATARYREGLKAMTRAQQHEVLKACCYGEVPVWIDQKDNQRALNHLRGGLDALIVCYVTGGK